MSLVTEFSGKKSLEVRLKYFDFLLIPLQQTLFEEDVGSGRLHCLWCLFDCIRHHWSF